MTTENAVALFVAAGLVASVICAVVFLREQRSETAGFSLSSALSEVIGFDASGQPRYVSSSSRFIALFGFILIFWLYAGIGVTIIAAGGKAPGDLRQIEEFMFFGVALFAPYIANQVRAALVGLGKGLPTNLAVSPPKKDET